MQKKDYSREMKARDEGKTITGVRRHGPKSITGERKERL